MAQLQIARKQTLRPLATSRTCCMFQCHTGQACLLSIVCSKCARPAGVWSDPRCAHHVVKLVDRAEVLAFVQSAAARRRRRRRDEAAQSDRIVVHCAGGARKCALLFVRHRGRAERDEQPVVVRRVRPVPAPGMERVCVVNQIGRGRRDHSTARQLTPVRV